MHQCICIFLQVKVYNLQEKQNKTKVCIKPTELQKELKIIIKCNFSFRCSSSQSVYM